MVSRKDAIRNELRNVRASMNVNDWRSGSLLIAEKAFQVPELRHADSVMFYLSMNDRREVDTAPLINLVTAKDTVSTFVPVSCDRTLCAVPFSKSDPVVAGRFGQPEPLHARTGIEEVPEVVIVPAVAVDREGRRLGYGMGYYDRFISGLRKKGGNPFIIALVFSFQLLDSLLPDDPWDEGLDCIVTETDVVRIYKP
ncbi:5-formyltetrahydrofolate cyclo-ligase [Prosthecochloris marina]|uniref:5-formyltetrahydrofolate cyclo-ligase n=1 Tax=Prosthecochloris marina TaxID=2017681 RepID=A0A317TBF3_9CHLB|nr:5-formyltetrahydrofolate cyclo-ligase [Prosthecochloris marina]PWW83046.1 5-formyltetrahydrofolate cyclo-ligase [Prosthecochloris marina]